LQSKRVSFGHLKAKKKGRRKRPLLSTKTIIRREGLFHMPENVGLDERENQKDVDQWSTQRSFCVPEAEGGGSGRVKGSSLLHFCQRGCGMKKKLDKVSNYNAKASTTPKNYSVLFRLGRRERPMHQKGTVQGLLPGRQDPFRRQVEVLISRKMRAFRCRDPLNHP